MQPRQGGVEGWLVADDTLLVSPGRFFLDKLNLSLFHRWSLKLCSLGREGRQEVQLRPDPVLATVDGHLALEREVGAVVLAAGEVP